MDCGGAAGSQGGRRRCGRRSCHCVADAGIENLGRGNRTATCHRSHRGQPPGRRRFVPELPAIHQYPDRPGAARRSPDAEPAGRAVPATHSRWSAALGAVGRARAPHQLRRADSLLQPGVEGLARHAAERAQGNAAGGCAAPHQHVLARVVGTGFFHAPHCGRLRNARRLSTIHRGLLVASAGRAR